MSKTLAFVYHTLQYGYPLYEADAKFLGKPIGRYRTTQPYPLCVTKQAVCYNQHCGFNHRLCGMYDRPGLGVPVEGDVFALDAEQLRLLDIEERYDPDGPPKKQRSFRRPIEVEPIDGGAPIVVETHFYDPVADVALEYVEQGYNELVACYTREMAAATPKACCVENPGHEGLHCVTPHPCD